MRVRVTLTIAALALSVAACQDLAGPVPADDTVIQAPQAQQTGPDNRCYGQISSFIASTWPWAHNDKVAFPPPKGSLALWVETFGPFLGISSVRELQLLFCG